MLHKFHSSVGLVAALFVVACSSVRIGHVGAMDPQRFVRVRVADLTEEKAFSATVWDAKAPLWCATLASVSDEQDGSEAKSFVLCYQTTPPCGQLYEGRELEIREFEYQRFVLARRQSILDWGDGWIRDPRTDPAELKTSGL